MSDEDSAAARPPAPSHTSTNQWQSFEMRMRRRRAERCVMRAEVALEAGFPDEARAALEEARRLDCSTPDFEALSAAIAPCPPLPLPRPAPSRVRVAVISMVAVAAASAWFWSGLVPKHADVAVARQAAQRTPAPDINLTGPAARSAERHPIISTEFVRPELERSNAGLRAESEDAGRPQPAKLERTAQGSGRDVATAPAAVAPLAGSPLSENLEPKRAEPGIVAHDAGVGSALLPNVTLPPALPQAAALIDERPRIRAALSRYEAGYSSLNVEGVRAVWPGVDARALSRAFDGLESQRISLGPCSIVVAAVTARAECHGTATWAPRIGGGTRTANRSWTFELRNASSAWQIVRVQAK